MCRLRAIRNSQVLTALRGILERESKAVLARVEKHAPKAMSLIAAAVVVPFGQRSVAWFGLAALLGIDNAPQASIALPADKIRVILGEGYDVPPADLEPDAETSVEPSTAEGWYGMTTSATPDQGRPMDGGGIPCVN